MDETKQFLEPVTSDTDCPSVCPLCLKQPSKYTCPRCNTRYCSLDCYKSEKHRDCSEMFYKHCFMEGMVYALPSFADPGIFIRGDPGQKQPEQWFFVCVCFSPQLILQCTEGGGPMVLLQRKLYFSKDPEGVQHFPGEVQLFDGWGGGVYFYSNPYNL